jgi:hypothetical protein
MPNIFNRVGTITYEVSKLLSNIPNEKITIIDKTLKASILNLDGKCEYCEINLAGTTDHFRPLVKDKVPSQYCNDYFNLVPCCTTCNSSKGGKTFIEWFIIKSPKNPFKNMDEDKKEKIRLKFIVYEDIFQKNHFIKNYPSEKINILNNKIKAFFKEIETETIDILKETVYTRVKYENVPTDTFVDMEIATIKIDPTDYYITLAKKPTKKIKYIKKDLVK